MDGDEETKNSPGDGDSGETHGLNSRPRAQLQSSAGNASAISNATPSDYLDMTQNQDHMTTFSLLAGELIVLTPKTIGGLVFTEFERC
jgi:hypothetical protein